MRGLARLSPRSELSCYLAKEHSWRSAWRARSLLSWTNLDTLARRRAGDRRYRDARKRQLDWGCCLSIAVAIGWCAAPAIRFARPGCFRTAEALLLVVRAV